MRNLLSELWNGLSIGVEMSELDYAQLPETSIKDLCSAGSTGCDGRTAEMEKHILRSMDDALTYYL